MPEDFGTWFSGKLKKAMGEEDKPKSLTPEENENRRKATEMAIGPRYQVHDASATTPAKGSVSAISKESVARKKGSVTNIVGVRRHGEK